MTKKKNFSRRQFIGTSLIGAAGLALIPACKFSAPSDTLRLGFIGLGRQAMYLMSSFIRLEGVEVIACADVYVRKNERFATRVKELYTEMEKEVQFNTYSDYRKLLENKDIDAVVIASPDHWHYHMATDALSAGKDIYLEKPLTFTIAEGKELVKSVRDHGRTLAVGSQQRSDAKFQHAYHMVQDGNIGALKSMDVWVGPNPHPKPYTLEEQVVPEDLDWKQWLGPNPYVHYNEELNPPIHPDVNNNKEEFWAGWRWYEGIGGGLMTDWGAHMFDIAQWGAGLDRTGPVKVIPAGAEGNEEMKYMYENGLEINVHAFDGETRGVKFWGEKSWLEVSRPKLVTSDESLAFVEDETEVPYEARSAHHKNFIDAIKNNVDPIAPVEAGHRTNTVCLMGNIANELGKSLEWNPDTEEFNDDAANELLSRDYSEGFKL